MTGDKKRMLAVYYYCVQGGVTSVIKQRMPALRDAGWDLDFVFKQDGGARQDLLNSGVRRVEVSERFFAEDAISMAGSEQYDCVVVFDAPELIQPLRRAFRGKLLYEIHTPIPRNLNKNSADVLVTADAVFVPSRWSKNWLLNRFAGVPQDRIAVVPNIVDETAFNVDGTRKGGMEKCLLWVGKLSEYKNWEEAVQIGLEFVRKRREWRFVMVTGAAYTEKEVRPLLQYVLAGNAADRISWIHNLGLNEMGVLYRGVADGGGMLLSSSLAESFCLVIHEAMRCGVPVVSTDVGAVTDIVSDDVTGLLYHPGDVRGALGKLDRLAADEQLRQRLVSNAFGELQRFSGERLRSEYLAELDRVVCRSRVER